MLEVTDNGVGMTDGNGKQKSNSFGMEMVEAFAQKLKATLTTENLPGVSTRLVIPNKAA